MIDDLRKYLADVRKRRGLSQAEVARRMGTSQSAVSELENEATNPTVGTLAAWATALDVELTFQVAAVHAFRLVPEPSP